MTSMTLPTIKFRFSPLTEANRLLFTSTQLVFKFNNSHTQGSFYLNHNFYLLPYLPPDPPPQLIYLPDLPYHQIPHFWEKMSQTPSHLPFNRHQDIAHHLTTLIDYQPHLLNQLAHQTQTLLDQHFPQFWHTLKQIFPHQTQWVDQIIIMPTLYGSIASFNRLPQPHRTIYIYLRHLSPQTEIFRVILFSLIRRQLEQQKMTWNQINQTIDYLLTNTAIHSTLPTTPTLLSHHLTKKQLGQYHRQTTAFIKKLGLLHLKPNLLHLKNNHPYYHHTKIDNLGPKELELLKLLLQNRGQIVSYDTIIQHLYPYNNNVYDWRITKLVQRLRQKLKSYHLPPSTIQAIRSQGYLII